jgi:hypothetical protein
MNNYLEEAMDKLLDDHNIFIDDLLEDGKKYNLPPLKQPEIILAIFDEPSTVDRYSIVLDEESKPGHLQCLCLSDSPEHPQGYSQFCYCQVEWYEENKNKIEWNMLPRTIQKHIILRLKPESN